MSGPPQSLSEILHFFNQQQLGLDRLAIADTEAMIDPDATSEEENVLREPFSSAPTSRSRKRQRTSYRETRTEPVQSDYAARRQIEVEHVVDHPERPHSTDSTISVQSPRSPFPHDPDTPRPVFLPRTPTAKSEPRCRCTLGVQPLPNLPWARLDIDPPPQEDRPFLCQTCRQSYTHRAKSCHQMRGIPWITPEMEADHICLDCWSALTADEREAYDMLFYNKWAPKFTLKPPTQTQKYMRMFDKIMNG